MNDRLRRAAALLESASDPLRGMNGVVGLDGFVDSIIRVVSKKLADGSPEFFPTITTFAERVGKAANMSTALELKVQKVKLGGNGPIMANALSQFGVPLTYLGAVGQEGDGVHPVFQPMEATCKVVPLCPAASTDALEFNDGKLMFQKMECLDTLDYDLIVKGLGGEDKVLELFDEATVVALNHWSSLPHMSDIWERLQAEICPRLSQKKRYLFFDLADPQKRDPDDIRRALSLIGKFSPWYDTTLGLNEKESAHICEVLGILIGESDRRRIMINRAKAIREAVGISSVVVHPVEFAAGADATGATAVDGPYVAEPLISTGAGDHFNAGYFLGRCLGGDLEVCLQTGVATSGYYVRTAESPTTQKLAGFVLSLAS